MFFDAAQVKFWFFVILQREIVTGQNWYTPPHYQVSLPQTLYTFYEVPLGKPYVSYYETVLKNPYGRYEITEPKLQDKRERLLKSPYSRTVVSESTPSYTTLENAPHVYSNSETEDRLSKATYANNEESIPGPSYSHNEKSVPKYSNSYIKESLSTHSDASDGTTEKNAYEQNEESDPKYFDVYNDQPVPIYSNANEKTVPTTLLDAYFTEDSKATNVQVETTPKPLSTTRLETPPSSDIQNPVANLLLQSVAPNYAPRTPNDIFDFLRDSYPLPNGLKSPLSEYDYIIVGAGSAGCVLASRLTEDPNVTVLVIEAGKPEFPMTDIPAIAPFFQRTEYIWPYFMEKQPGVCLGMINERCFWPRGKAVGGTSVINYMIYTRGRPEDWNRIAKEGNYGWSYNDVAKYYMKSERANLEGLQMSRHHGKDGNLNVEFVAYKTPLIEAFLESGRILGHPTVDYNAPERLGFGYVQTTTTHGRRVSAAKAFLHPYRNRPNLHILPRTRTTKILIDPDTKTAYGVQYVRNRLRYEVRARREVIVSAGPIASPQLLMLSGVGPRKHLNSLSIPVIQDLPVGRTLYDHITFPGLIFTVNVSDSSITENRQTSLQTVIQWLQFGDSVAATPGAVEGIGYLKTPLSDEPDGIPDIELISIGGSLVSDGGPGASKAVRRGIMISDEVFDGAFGSIDGTDTWSAFPMLLHPKSKGYLELKDTNPFSYPRMYGNYLTHPVDVAKFIASIRHIQALASTPPFQRFGAKIHRARLPTCRDYRFDTDQYWECAVRTLTVTLHHQIATCRMGPASDSKAVVDPELRVYGVNRLRVVDSSVIPRTVSAHTNAPAIMIGEKAADLIKATWDSAYNNL